MDDFGFPSKTKANMLCWKSQLWVPCFSYIKRSENMLFSSVAILKATVFERTDSMRLKLKEMKWNLLLYSHCGKNLLIPGNSWWIKNTIYFFQWRKKGPLTSWWYFVLKRLCWNPPLLKFAQWAKTILSSIILLLWWKLVNSMPEIGLIGPLAKLRTVLRWYNEVASWL